MAAGAGIAGALERSFSPATVQRGQRVFDAGLVATVRETDGGWAGVVHSESAEGRRYTVRIEEHGDALGGILREYAGAAQPRRGLSCSCTCPVGRNCKHAAAVVMAIESRLGHSGRAGGADPGLSFAPGTPSGPSRPGSLARRPAADADAWKTAYWLKKNGSAYDLRGLEGGWSVSRVLVFRKRDGAEGRLKRWSPAYASCPLPPGSEALEACLRSHGGEEAPAGAAGILAARLPPGGGPATLYVSPRDDPARAALLPVLPAETARLGFLPGSTEDNSITWRPALSFRRPDGAFGTAVRAAVRCSGGILYLCDDAVFAALAPPFARGAVAEALGLLAADPSGRPDMGRDGAEALAAALAALCGDSLTAARPPSRTAIVRLAPSAALILEPRHGGVRHGELRCELSFTYAGISFGARPRELAVHGDELRVTERDRAAEDGYRDALRAILGGHAPSARALAAGAFDLGLSLGSFAADFLDPLAGAGISLMVRMGRAARPVRPARLAASVASGVDWFSAALRLDADGYSVPLDGAAAWLGPNLLSAGDDVLAVSEGDRGLLALFAKARRTAEGSILVDARDLALASALNAISDEADKPATEARAALYAALSGLAPVADVAPPPGFRAAFRPYQAAGYSWLMRLASAGLGALLADDMGLGKTVQAIAALLRLKEEGLLRPAIVVAPVTVLSNWEAEIARFAPGLSAARHHGQARAKTRDALVAILLSHDIILTSYQTLRADAALLAGMEYGAAILDEAQAVKNPGAAMARATRSLRARCRIALTGTPVENRPLDLWSHFAFLNPGLLGTRKEFLASYEKPIAEGDGEALESLRRRSAPFILRRTKEAVLDDLPPKEEIVRWIDLGPAQAAYYEALRRQCADSVGRSLADRGVGRSAVCVLEALLRLRQAAIHPALVSEAHASIDGAKIADAAGLALRLVDEGHRALVFSQFTSALALVRERLEAAGQAYEYLDGQTRDRAERIARFQAGTGGGVFLLSLKAGGVGINLTNADYVLLLDPWWNPAAESQAVDRAHRMGQKKPVTVYRLVARGTIEEKVLLLQERKRGLVEGLVSDGPDGLAGLSGDEILGLFG